MTTTLAASAASAWIDAGPRTTVIVRGSDAARFIDGFTTAAIAPLVPGSGTEGFFADAKGWVLALAAILRTEDGVWIDAFPGGAVSLAEHLERYHIREQLEIIDETAARANIVVTGAAARAAIEALGGVSVPHDPWGHVQGTIGGMPVAVVAVPWAGPGGCLVQAAVVDRARVVAAFEAAGIPAADAKAFERLRIEQGWPAPVDIPAKTLPQELDRDGTAISFTKGCYLGQETVARLDALGHANRRLVGLAAAGAIEVGTTVRAAGVACGSITSVCRSPRAGGWLGLAVLPVKACAADVMLDAGGTPVRVVELPLPEPAAEPTPPSSRGGEVVFAARRFRVVRITEPGVARQREVVEHPGSVVVLPLVTPDQVCLVEVVRVAVGETLLELPAGTLDRVETLAEAAARELAEETGYRAGRMASLGGFWMSPGILHERMHLFVAEDLVPGPQALEPGEQIRTRVVPVAEAVAMCLDGRIQDAKTVAGLLLWAARGRGQACGTVTGA
ncbi:MAG: NUDIX domain-containing protein [Planctomycetia bacterium]